MTSPASDSSDEALVARAAAGEDAAFETLVKRYQHRVYRLVCRLTSETDAPDILQETFLQVHRHLPAFRGESRFSTWLYRIATNAALMHRRAQARRPTESLDTLLPQFDADGRHRQQPEALQVVSRVDELLDRETLAREAKEAIDRLPDLYREAFVLRDLEQLPTGDVAQILGVESSTVRQRVHRARLLMRGYLSHLVGVEP
jgi:RNA polymerase sigma-70 factor, ECF subfamily